VYHPIILELYYLCLWYSISYHNTSCTCHKLY